MCKNLFIVHVTIGFGGGVGTVIQNLIEYQLEQGYKVGLMYPEYESKYATNFMQSFGQSVIKLPVQIKAVKGLNQLIGMPIKKIYNELILSNDKHKIIFHAHNPIAVGLLQDIKQVPILCTIHGVNTQRSFISNQITNTIIRRLVKHHCLIAAISNSVTSHYNQLLNSSNIKTVLNGVRIQPIKGPYKFNKFTIGYLAFINDLKGWRVLFDAYNLLDDYYKKNIDLVFAGTGSDKEIEDLYRLIEINQLQNNVYYLGLVANAKSILTPNIDLVILPSSSEGLGMTLVESIANGVPILATKVGGIPEVLSDGINGYFIERSASDIAEKIKLIYDDNILYQSFKKNCIKIYTEKFSVEKMGEGYFSLYKQIGE